MPPGEKICTHGEFLDIIGISTLSTENDAVGNFWEGTGCSPQLIDIIHICFTC